MIKMFSFRSQIVKVLFMLSVVGLAAQGADEILVWRGCGVSKTAFMEECRNAYLKETGVEIRLSGGGATLGIESAAKGGADLGGTCRACLDVLGEDKLDVELAAVAWDALVIVVHPDNPVENISREQLRMVLQQKITNWKQLGGNDESIVVVARRGKTSGVGYSTRQLILEGSEEDYGKSVVRLNSSGPVEKLVERQPRAIAITGVSSARHRDLKVIAIDSQAPTPENIASGKYPYFRPLYVAYKPDTNSGARRFVEWLLSDKGQSVVAAQQTVTLKQGARLTQQFKHFGDVKQIVNFEHLRKLAENPVEN